MNRTVLRRMLREPSGLLGLVLLVLVLLVALAGPYIAPNSPTDTLGTVGAPPGGGFALGTDYLGRDVLSRLLNGGRSVIFIGLTATILAYIIGVIAGLYAGYRSGIRDTVTMRSVDVILAFPPLLILLLLVGGFRQHVWVLVVGVVIVQTPGIARITRTATLSVSKTSYVEAAQTRGDSTRTIWRKDIIPNIQAVLLADFGIRFAVSIVLIASMNYLGLGLAPPASDWGLMMSENQSIISLNPMAVLGPAIMLALLTVSINLIADAYLRAISGGQDNIVKRLRRAPRTPAGLPLEPAPVPGEGSLT